MVGGGGCAPAHRPTLAAARTSPVVGCRAAAGTPGRTALSRVALRDWHEFHLVRIVVECGPLTTITLNYLSIFVNEGIFERKNTFVACIILTDIWEIQVYNAVPNSFEEMRKAFEVFARE